MISEVLVILETETFCGTEGDPTIIKQKCWI